MNPIWILLIGMAVVIGGVLALRLHAFLALIFGALMVAALTSEPQIRQQAIDDSAVDIVAVDSALISLKPGKGQSVIAGQNMLLRPGADPMAVRVEARDPSPDRPKTKRVEIVNGPSAQTGDQLIHQTHYDAAFKAARQGIGSRLAEGFGDTAMKIGILIAMAAIIGKCLLDSGAAERIVVAARNLFGEKRISLAFLGSGFVVGVPVFFDTVFYLLLPLGKAMRLKTGKNYVLYVLTIVAGATMAHSLVPPTPGPLFVAGELGVDVGLMMLGGIGVGLITVTFGYLYALWADKKWNIPLRASADLNEDELRRMATRDIKTLPPLWASVLPIVIPVGLIAGGTAMQMLYAGAAQKPAWLPTLLALSDKNLALILAAVVALVLLVWRTGSSALSTAAATALSSGGVIILITSAGGAFGQVLRQTGIASAVGSLVPDSGSALLWLPIAFFLTALVRIAQGSATVAMITTVGIVGPVATGGDLGFHPLWLALAIGCGSKPIPWMNDSGFWIISKMSGFTEAETLKTASAMMTLMGLVGLIATMLGAWLIPLV